jgi:SnoaL-like domain
MNIEELAAKVQRLSDLEEIKTLRAQYSYVANIIDGVAGGPDAFAALFAEDGTVDFGAGEARGRAAIAQMIRDMSTQWQAVMHYMLNEVIELEGDRANGKVTGLFAFTTKTRPAPIWMSNIYTDTYVRTKQGWRFQSVTIKTAFADPAYFEAYAELMDAVRK